MGLPSSRRTPLTFAVLSDPGRLLAPGRCGAQTWPLLLLRQRHPPVMTFGALSHGLSHRCLRFVPSSRTTTQNSLPVADRPFRVGFSMPTEFVWRVSHLHAFPSPRAYSWREAILILTEAAALALAGEPVFLRRAPLASCPANYFYSLLDSISPFRYFWVSGPTTSHPGAAGPPGRCRADSRLAPRPSQLESHAALPRTMFHLELAQRRRPVKGHGRSQPAFEAGGPRPD